MFLHIVKTEYVSDYEVAVVFSDGKQGVADLSELLHGTVFEPLKDKAVFAQLRLDSELETLVWPNGADVAPEYVYYQAFRDDPQLQDQFKQWEYIS